jgi:DNA-directed DNA polymerase III PolC
MTFTHLHVRSCFSFLEGASTLDELCRAVRGHGQSAFALTDRNALYGLPAYLQACEAHQLQPVVGAVLDQPGGPRGQASATQAVLLPRSRAGYAALCRALTARHRDPAFDLVERLVADASDLVVLSSHAPLLDALREARGGPDGLYVELVRGRHPLREALALRLDLPLVATTAAVMANPEDHPRHRVLRAIGGRTTLGRLEPTACEPPEACLWGPARLAEAFWGEEGQAALRATAEVGEACRFGGREWGFGVLTFPRWEGDGEDAARALRRLATEGARRRYGVPSGHPLPGRVRRRLDHELDLVVRKGFADYFLIVREIVRGRERTCGRGSAAASLIAYALGITHVDPVRHDLFFERFLNEGREHPPDVDIDFPWDERDGVLERVFSEWGARAAMVANHVCFRPRAALREVAHSFGLPEQEIVRVTARLPYFMHGGARGGGGGQSAGGSQGVAAGPPSGIKETLASHPLAQGLELHPPWDRVVALAGRINGFPRYLSVHPGGVVITPHPLTDLVPVETAAKGVPVIQWEKDGAEEAGLVKIDILGNRSLAVIRDALEAVAARGERAPSYRDLDPTDDPRCQEMLARGQSMGCFYVESPAMRALQARSGRGDFPHLVIHSSIIRPAANVFIREYLRRLHGGPWPPLHPGLERTLQETLGLMAYQEDLARVAIELAGFTPREADRLRKVLSKKATDYRLADLRARFTEGALQRGLPQELIDSVWTMMESFAGYSFCKAHSASYALVSFKCCWLRDRYPAEFLAGVISNGGGFYSTLGYLGEARRLGLRVLPACVNHSQWSWTGRERELRVGLLQLVGFRRVAADALLAARARGGPFLGLADLVGRVPSLERDELHALTRAGALDDLPDEQQRTSEVVGRANRARLHWRIALLGPRLAAGGLFGDPLFRDALVTLAEPPPVADHSAALALEHELLAYGIPVTVHPLDLWGPGIDDLDAVPAADLPRHVGRRVKVCGWLVTAKVVTTRHRDPMEFVTLEDRSGLIECTVFPEIYRRRARVLHAPRPLVITGRVEQEYGVCSLIAERIESWWGACRIAEPAFADAADHYQEELLG